MTISEKLPGPQDIDLIVTDVDGTLLDSTHKLHRKQRRSVAEIREPLDLDGFPASHLNGCVVYAPHGKVILELGLELDIITKLYTQFRAAGVSLYFYDKETVYEVPGKDGPKWGDILRGYGEDVQLLDEAHLVKIRSGELKIIKAAICQEQGDGLTQSRRILQNEYPASAFTLTQALPFCVELIPTTGSKGIALAKIIGTETDPERVVAFGDGENDVSMFQVAGYSVSMANAMPIAKEHATCSTLSNDEGGVGVWLEKVYGFEYEEKPYDYWLH
ncbi:hypothetical protein MRB53_039084 [Persea americana]|nr:hypothetical protein MRB53_039084 [Persea americana]